VFSTVQQHPDERVVFATPDSSFAALIWDHDGASNQAGMEQAIDRLLDAGCRYLVCGGRKCETWHDLADAIFGIRTLDFSEAASDAIFLMTTWHTDESVDDVANFFVLNTSIDGNRPGNFLVVNVGRDPGEAVDLAVKKLAARLA